MENESILITGGAGSIGSELVRQLAEKNQVYFIDTNETALFDLYEELRQEGKSVLARVGDVRDSKIFDEIVREWLMPTYIFHAAALKHVTPSSWSPEEYITTNILGTLNVLKAGLKYHAKVINISTDKVVHANSVMGATKKVAEIMTRDAKQISVRFGNVMGSRGSVIPIWQKQLEENKPLTVTDGKMTRYMMTIPQACTLVIKAASVGVGGEVFILKMGDPVNVLELAQEILKKSGKNIEVKMIGVRPGETLDEKLYTEEESTHLEEIEDLLVIK